MDNIAFWNQAAQEISKYDLLQHPFYKAWSAGELTIEDLRFYAAQYYRHVSAFPAYLTALHARLPEGRMRREVLANAWDEECGEVAHSDLWLRFLEGMGGAAADLPDHPALPEVDDLVSEFRSIAQQAPVAAAFGAFFAYESQVPKIAAEKLAGLKTHYGCDDRACKYFSLHRTADVHHSNVWRTIISELVASEPVASEPVAKDERHAQEALDGISRAARALWTALDGIERERPGRRSASCAATSRS